MGERRGARGCSPVVTVALAKGFRISVELKLKMVKKDHAKIKERSGRIQKDQKREKHREEGIWQVGIKVKGQLYLIGFGRQ
jgi:hypothetical protein